jgi:hypothetical protein
MPVSEREKRPKITTKSYFLVSIEITYSCNFYIKILDKESLTISRAKSKTSNFGFHE